MEKPKGYVDQDYLIMLAQIAERYKQASYERMQLQPGDHMLDVGCGPATDTLNLAMLVGPDGQVTGVDYDAEMIVVANRRCSDAGLSRQIRHVQAYATALPFEDDRFDACRSERLFQHLLDPARALAEMARVTKPGGMIVVADTDWSTLSIDTPETELQWRLLRFRTEHRVHNAFSGRNLYRLFRHQELQDLMIEACPGLFYGSALALFRRVAVLDEIEGKALQTGILTAEELQRWKASLQHVSENGVLFASIMMIMVAGRKPEMASN